jgi:cytochrome c556
MKNGLLVLALTSGVLFAQNPEKIDMKKNMQELEVAMAVIQRGFLYNDSTLVNGGVKNLQQRIKHIEPPSKEDEILLGKGNTYSYKYAKRQSAKIAVLSEEILTHYNMGEKYTAMSRYKDTLKQCLACHKKIRKW